MLQSAWLRHGQWSRVALAAAFGLVLGMYLANHDMNGDPNSPRGDGRYRPVLARGDGHMMYLMARSTALDGDWVFNNDLARFGDPWNQPRGPTGRKLIPHPVGPPLVWTPLIWTSELGAVVANVFGADIPLHGYTQWHQRFVFLSSVLFGCGAVLMGRRVARAAIGGAAAPTYGAIGILLGTSLTYYVTYMPSYGHAMDAFACGAFLWYWSATLGRTDRKRWVVLGALLGASMLVRVQEFGMAVVLVLETVVAVVTDARSSLRAGGHRLLRSLEHGAITLTVALLVFIPQLLYWRLLYGDFFAVPQGSKYTRLGSPMMLELLYSARNGWFSTTPIAYFAVIGLFCLPRRSRLLAAGLLSAVLVQVYLNSTIMDWWGMASFGQRRLCSVTLPLVIGLAAFVWRVGRLLSRCHVPRAASHALAVITLGSFLLWNINRVRDYKAGKAAPAELVPTCCKDVPARVRGPIQWIYDRIGNPFEFPANALFAWKHRVPIQRWDQAVGNYPVIPPANALFDGTLFQQRGSWRMGHPGAEPYIVQGLSRSFTSDRPFRWTVSSVATVLVPNLMPYDQRVTVWLAPGAAQRVEVFWDGESVARVDLTPGWNAVAFSRASMSVGEHELSIAAELGRFQGAQGWPSTTEPVGVALGSVDMQLLPSE